MSYGIHTPALTYALFENALRAHYGLSLEEHRDKLGRLYQRFNAVAANNPLSWFPTERSAQEIATVSDSNRYVGFPYTKFLNSVIQVNMGAAVILTSVAKARELGVADERMVYLHGCADAHDLWNVSERVDYHSSPAVRTVGEKAFAMADKTIDDMDYLDIYSCFPSAVQIACDELGIAHDDARGLTVTGGLPYFGGPGNNYVMHSIASMMDVLRENPGKFGLLNGNGWFVTKHSLGIYSTTPVQGEWRRENPADYQQPILDAEHPAFTETPQGSATVETYTVMHGRGGMERGLVIGRLDDGTRFIAETPSDEQTLLQMMDREMIGTSGTVSSADGKNVFVPEFA
jgi:acetyl-CoA C-acetyltransferase